MVPGTGLEGSVEAEAGAEAEAEAEVEPTQLGTSDGGVVPPAEEDGVRDEPLEPHSLNDVGLFSVVG